MSANVASGSFRPEFGGCGPVRLRWELLQEHVEGFPNRADANELAVARLGAVVRIDVRFGHDAPPESHLRRLADAQRRLRDAADLPGETDFAEHRGGRWNDAIADARRNRGEHPEIRRGLVHRH